MDDSVGRESYDHKGDSCQKHCIKVMTKLSGCCIDENRSYNIHFTNLHNNPRFIAILEKMGWQA